MRDHRKLDAFWLADTLAIGVYRATREFPKTERYGLTSQMRKSAVSIPSNIVEGSARKSEADYLKFLNISYTSAKELQYQCQFAHRVGFLGDDVFDWLEKQASRTCGGLFKLIKSYEDAAGA